MNEEQLINLPIEWKRGSGLRKSDLNNEGKYKCILYGELYTKYKKPLIQSDDLSRTNKLGKILSQKGDILIPGTSTAAKKDMLLACEIDEDGVFLGGDINIIRPKQGLFAKKFVPYFFETSNAYDQLDKYITGATGIIHISNSGLKNLKIPLPPLSEQKRIVGILDKVFEAIDIAKADAERNLQNAKELFESFLNEIFEKKGDDWEKKRLGNIIKYDKIQNTHKNLPYVGLEHIQSNTGIFLGDLEPQEVKSSTFHFTEQHVLYGRLRPYLNKVLLPNFEGHCSTEIFPIKVGKEIVREFLFYWLMTETIVKKIDGTWTGTRMPRANMNQVLEFSFAFPPISQQKQIVRQLDNLREETKKLEEIYQKKLDNLEELKKSVLQKAFEGEL